jgi:hypothetical protein
MHPESLPFYAWVLIAIIMTSQASLIFFDASKRGENKWIWGLYGLTNFPSALIVYLLVTRVFAKENVCNPCKRKFRAAYRYCPYCGKETQKLPKKHKI